MDDRSYSLEDPNFTSFLNVPQPLSLSECDFLFLRNTALKILVSVTFPDLSNKATFTLNFLSKQTFLITILAFKSLSAHLLKSTGSVSTSLQNSPKP